MDFRQTYQKEKTSNKDKESLQIFKKSSGRRAGSNRRPKMCESDRSHSAMWSTLFCKALCEKRYIGKKIKLEPVTLAGESSLHGLLDYYMGKNTPERQEFIINRLKIEDELEPVKEDLEEVIEV